MLVTEFVPRVFRKATGKIPTFTTGSTKWLKILDIANEYIDTWAREPGVDWASLASPDLSIGTVTNTNTFPLLTTIRKISSREEDYVRIVHTDGVTYTDYTTVPVEKLKDYIDSGGTYVTQVGGANKTGVPSNLVFNHTFVSTDPQFGGSINVPAYLFAPHIAADTDDIPVDDPQWLVLVCAAEYIRTDVTRQLQYSNLVAEANAAMDRMRDDNDPQETLINRPWRPIAMTWS
jgi:hypothetical protein